MTKEEIKAVIEVLQEKYLLEIEELICENQRLKAELEELRNQNNSLDEYSSNLLKSNQELSLIVNQIKGGFEFICPNCGTEHKLGVEILVDKMSVDIIHKEFFNILEGDTIQETDFIVKLVDESMVGKPFKYGVYPPILRRL